MPPMPIAMPVAADASAITAVATRRKREGCTTAETAMDMEETEMDG